MILFYLVACHHLRVFRHTVTTVVTSSVLKIELVRNIVARNLVHRAHAFLVSARTRGSGIINFKTLRLSKTQTGSSNGGIKTCVAVARPYFCSILANGRLFWSIFEQRKNQIFSLLRRVKSFTGNQKTQAILLANASRRRNNDSSQYDTRCWCNSASNPSKTRKA